MLAKLIRVLLLFQLWPIKFSLNLNVNGDFLVQASKQSKHSQNKEKFNRCMLGIKWNGIFLAFASLLGNEHFRDDIPEPKNKPTSNSKWTEISTKRHSSLFIEICYGKPVTIIKFKHWLTHNTKWPPRQYHCNKACKTKAMRNGSVKWLECEKYWDTLRMCHQMTLLACERHIWNRVAMLSTRWVFHFECDAFRHSKTN